MCSMAVASVTRVEAVPQAHAVVGAGADAEAGTWGVGEGDQDLAALGCEGDVGGGADAVLEGGPAGVARGAGRLVHSRDVDESGGVAGADKRTAVVGCDNGGVWVVGLDGGVDPSPAEEVDPAARRAGKDVDVGTALTAGKVGGERGRRGSRP